MTFFSHDFDIRGYKPDKTIKVEGKDREHTVYLFTIPLQKE